MGGGQGDWAGGAVSVDRIATANIRVTLSDQEAERALRTVIRDGNPELVAIQEWDAGDPFGESDPPVLRSGAVEQAMRRIGGFWDFDRHPAGGGPFAWNVQRYGLERLRLHVLAPEQHVGHLPGRKSILPASKAIAGRFADEVDGGSIVVINAHLCAEVQDRTGRYRTDEAHRKRVKRHRAERRALRRLAWSYKARGFKVYVCADTNFDGFRMRGFTSCWKDRPGGTLGSRAVDVVLADRKADDVRTIDTRSDHDAVVAVYRQAHK